MSRLTLIGLKMDVFVRGWRVLVGGLVVWGWRVLVGGLVVWCWGSMIVEVERLRLIGSFWQGPFANFRY